MCRIKELINGVKDRQHSYMKLAKKGKDVPAYEVQFLLQMIIGDLEAIERENRWVKIEEGLPNEGDDVVVIDKNGCEFLAFYECENFIKNDESLSFDKLIEIVKWRKV